MGQNDHAFKLLDRYAQVVVKHGTCVECVDMDGNMQTGTNGKGDYLEHAGGATAGRRARNLGDRRYRTMERSSGGLGCRKEPPGCRSPTGVAAAAGRSAMKTVATGSIRPGAKRR